MPYNSGIPNATDIIAQSQSQIKDNFAALVSWGNGYGNFTLQGSTPSGGITSNQIYTKAYATTSTNELYLQKQVVDAPSTVPFSASIMSNTAIASCDSGWSYLPSGLLIKWGTKDITSNGISASIAVNTISGGPAFNRAFQAFFTPYNPNTSFTFVVSLNTLTQTGGSAGEFSVNASSGANASSKIKYLVIGV